jgi:hypothetical protein
MSKKACNIFEVTSLAILILSAILLTVVIK